MTEAERAYRAAQAAIAQALAAGRDTLDLNAPEFRELAVLPPSVSQLTQLREVELDYTKVVELGPLQPLSGLRHLFLERVPIRDLAPLAGMTGLARLTLGHSHVDDLRALSGLHALTLLTLDNTDVTDLAPLIGLNRLTTLSIENTPVKDLSPLLHLPGLWDGSGALGLHFVGCTAARHDPALAKIAAIKGNVPRAAALRTYLEQ